MIYLGKIQSYIYTVHQVNIYIGIRGYFDQIKYLVALMHCKKMIEAQG